MKIVCLIRGSAPLLWFVNQVHAAHPVALVVVEAPPLGPRVRRKWKREGARGLAGVAQARLRGLRRRAAHEAERVRVLGEAWQALPAGVEQLVVPSINAPEVQERLTALKPDLILDHGTSIVRDRILETAPLALNLHWGLSPYYRGTHCTEWALVRHDPLNIGVTVHRLSREVDGGDVLGQARATLSPEDTVHSIDLQLTKLGTGIVVDAVGLLAAGETLSFHEQDLSRGHITRMREFSPLVERHVDRLLAEGGVKRMLARPGAEPLPIAEWTR